MDIKRDRMVFLGYGKYWRSDGSVGLMPIEEERGPERRTNVFVQGRRDPNGASGTEHTLLRGLVRAASRSGAGCRRLRPRAY